MGPTLSSLLRKILIKDDCCFVIWRQWVKARMGEEGEFIRDYTGSLETWQGADEIDAELSERLHLLFNVGYEDDDKFRTVVERSLYEETTYRFKYLMQMLQFSPGHAQVLRDYGRYFQALYDDILPVVHTRLRTQSPNAYQCLFPSDGQHEEEDEEAHAQKVLMGLQFRSSSVAKIDAMSTDELPIHQLPDNVKQSLMYLKSYLDTIFAWDMSSLENDVVRVLSRSFFGRQWITSIYDGSQVPGNPAVLMAYHHHVVVASVVFDVLKQTAMMMKFPSHKEVLLLDTLNKVEAIQIDFLSQHALPGYIIPTPPRIVGQRKVVMPSQLLTNATTALSRMNAFQTGANRNSEGISAAHRRSSFARNIRKMSLPAQALSKPIAPRKTMTLSFDNASRPPTVYSEGHNVDGGGRQ